MNFSPISVGLIGIGGYGRTHLNNLLSLQGAGLCRLNAVADPFADRHPETVAALRAEGVAVYDEATQLLERDEIDAVFIASPIPLHVPQTLEAFAAGKHVYLEKPPCVTVGEHYQLLEAQERAGKVCAVGFQLQTMPALKYVKRQLCEGAVGALKTIRASIRWRRDDSYYGRSPWAGKWRLNGQPVFDGPATNALSHVVHAALHLAGPTEESWASVERVRGCLQKARPIESYDSVYFEVETAEGVRVQFAFTHASSEHDDIALHCSGEKGTIVLDWDRRGGEVTLKPQEDEPQRLLFAGNPTQIIPLDFFRALHDSEHKPASALADVRAYLLATNGALQSSLAERELSFPEDRVHRIGDAPEGIYIVEGLDQEFLDFACNEQAPPASLPPGAWLAANQVALELSV